MVLHTNELGPAVLLGAELHHGELVGVHGASPNIVNFTRLDEVVESFHCFFNRHVFVKAVNLKKIKVWCVESFEGGIYGIEDSLARKTWK